MNKKTTLYLLLFVIFAITIFIVAFVFGGKLFKKANISSSSKNIQEPTYSDEEVMKALNQKSKENNTKEFSDEDAAKALKKQEIKQDVSTKAQDSGSSRLSDDSQETIQYSDQDVLKALQGAK